MKNLTLLFVAGLLMPGLAAAAPITSAGSIPGTPVVVNFSQFPGSFNFTTGPIQVGGLVGEDIQWSSNSSNSVIGNGGYNLGSNGSWDSGRVGYVGSNSNTAIMRFSFNDGPVGAVGGFINYSINSDASGEVAIRAFEPIKAKDKAGLEAEARDLLKVFAPDAAPTVRFEAA